MHGATKEDPYVLSAIMAFIHAYSWDYFSVLYFVANQMKVNFNNINGGRNNTVPTHTHTPTRTHRTGGCLAHM